MSKGLQILQEIGAQKIHENTHISREHVQALLHGSFDSLNKIQFVGFISILEKYYNIELDELKQKGLEYFKDKSDSDKGNHRIFVVPEKRKSYKNFYLIIVVVIFIVAVSYRFLSSTSVIGNQTVDNTIIDNAKDNIVKIEEVNTTLKDDNLSVKDLNASVNDLNISEEVLPIEEPKVIAKKSFKVMPNARLWIGYIDMITHKKFQKTFKGELDLDPDKEWLLSLGHGNVAFEINGELKEFNTKNNIRFVYRNGELKKITFEEFKRLNKGKAW